MKLKEIANKLTGFSTPIFGISWTPAKLEIETARKVLNFLDNRRVLYVVHELESPTNCIKSILEIREYLVGQLSDLDNNSELANILKAMLDACINFLNRVQEQYYFDKEEGNIKHNLNEHEKIHFYNAMGELRATMGILIAMIIVVYSLSYEGKLINIFPYSTDKNTLTSLLKDKL